MLAAIWKKPVARGLAGVNRAIRQNYVGKTGGEVRVEGGSAIVDRPDGVPAGDLPNRSMPMPDATSIAANLLWVAVKPNKRWG